MAKSDYLENAILNAVFNATSFSLAGDPYISLHTGDPGKTGANEVVGGSYVRKQAAFGAAASGQVQNSASIDWTAMPASTITHVGVWDAVSGGNFLWGGSLSVSRVVASGGSFSIGANRITVSEDTTT